MMIYGEYYKVHVDHDLIRPHFVCCCCFRLQYKGMHHGCGCTKNKECTEDYECVFAKLKGEEIPAACKKLA